MISDFEYDLWVPKDPRAYLSLAKFRVTDDNWSEARISLEDWQLLKSKVDADGEWWYVADTTPFSGFGQLVQFRNGQVVARSRLLWKS